MTRTPLGELLQASACFPALCVECVEAIRQENQSVCSGVRQETKSPCKLLKNKELTAKTRDCASGAKGRPFESARAYHIFQSLTANNLQRIVVRFKALWFNSPQKPRKRCMPADKLKRTNDLASRYQGRLGKRSRAFGPIRKSRSSATAPTS
jgi:hypothetical protein